jgi:hypothetical protein
LVNASKEFISTGKMTKAANGMYELSFESNNQYVGYDMVTITLEKMMDATPEKHILEGRAQ